MKPINKLLSTATLLCWASMALAGEPIAGVDVKLNKNPGGSVAKVKSDANGNYQFSKLAPGNYDLCIADEPCKLVVVGKEGTVKGQTQKHNYIGTVTLVK